MTIHASMLPTPPTRADDLPAITRVQWQAVLGAEPAEAAPWMAAAAQLGHAQAQTVLGQWHLDGRGVGRDPAQALHWFLRASHLGNAMGYAGMLAARGREAEALQWLAKVPATATPRYLKQAGTLLGSRPMRRSARSASACWPVSKP